MNSNSSNGMMTNVCGPSGWLFLHTVTFGYPMNPDEFDVSNELPVGTTREHYKQFFEQCGYVLPCRYCRDSFIQFSKEDPVSNSLENRETLTKWLYRIHERVNDKLNKKGITYEELVTRYESYRASCNKDKKGCSVPLGFSNKQKTCVFIYSEIAITTLLLGILICILLFMYVSKNKK